MISIQHPIASTASLSDRANTILKWVPMAAQWFVNAINDNAKSYVFSSESALLNSIIRGLYSADTVRVPKAQIVASVDYLMSLSDAQIKILKQVSEATDPLETSLAEQLSQLVQDEVIVDGDAISNVKRFFEQYQVQNHPSLQILTQEDVADWFAVIHDIQSFQCSKSVVQNALDFTLAQSLDCRSLAKTFGFASQIYQKLLNSSSTKRINASLQQDFQVAYQLIVRTGMDNLACPQLVPPQSPADAGSIIRHWGAHNQVVGFSDLPSALWQMAKNIELNMEQLNQYLPDQFAQLRQKLILFQQNATVVKQSLSQDAKNWCYLVRGGQLQCHMLLTEDGCLSLQQIQQIH